MVITASQTKTKFVLPKGGWESDEKTPEDAAQREAYEEAGMTISIYYSPNPRSGITGRIVKDLGIIEDSRSPAAFRQRPGNFHFAIYHFFEMIVEKEFEQYPEMLKRERIWVG